MKTIDEKIALKEKIFFLKEKKAIDLFNLKQQYHKTVASFTPLNLLKATTSDLLSTPNLKSMVFNEIIGFGTRYVAKKILPEQSKNPIKQMLRKFLFKFNN